MTIDTGIDACECVISKGAVHMWDLGSGRALVLLQGHVGAVHSVAFSSDSSALCSGQVSERELVIMNSCFLLNLLITPCSPMHVCLYICLSV